MTQALRKALSRCTILLLCLLIFTTSYQFNTPVIGDIGDTVIVNESPGGSARPEIAISSTDDIFVVWEKGSGSKEILSAKMVGGGATFDSEVNVSNDTADSREPGVAISSTDDIFVVWERGGSNRDILLAKSVDGGDTFGAATNVSNNTGSSARPEIAISSTDDIFVVWENIATGNILLAKSVDGGDTFGAAVPVTGNSGINPAVGIYGSDAIFVTWEDDSSSEIILAKSVDGGDTFGSEINVSDDPQLSTEPTMSISSTGIVYVAWTSLDEEIGANEVLLSKSAAGNTSFGAATNASPFDSIESFQPNLSEPSGTDTVFLAWTDFSVSAGDIFLAEIIELPEASLTLVGDIETDPRWGLDQVNLQGIAGDFGDGDSIAIDWGDGTTTPGISISSDGSWSKSKVYDSASVSTNPHAVVARLVDSDGNVKAESAEVAINIQKHVTEISMNRVSSVKEGQQVSVSGSLVDLSTASGSGIANRNITFSGTGVTDVSPAVTDDDGHFTSTGLAVGVGMLKTIQPNFAGDDLYLPSEGEIETYSVVDNSTIEFDLSSGTSSEVNLVGFGASVSFDSVVESGKVYAAGCDAPPDPRYIALGICIAISTSAKLAENTAANIEVSFNGTDIPEPYGVANIDLFYEGLGGMIDITESRDLGTNMVVGNAEHFGRFIVGIALHDPPLSASIRKELLSGNGRTISPDISIITLDKQEYEMSDTPSVTIVDLNANIDVLSKDTISANVSSTASHPSGITLSLAETDKDTGVFVGTFTFTDGPSEGTSLQASDGDEIIVLYEQAAARFTAIFDSIAEAGVADISSGEVLNPGPIVPFTAPILLELVDAQMESASFVAVTMSYEDVDLNNADGTSLRLLHQISETDNWVDITLPNGEGHNLDNFTITGNASFAGTFVIGCDVDQTQSCSGGPGGAGGGPVKSGVVVLDSTASVRRDGTNDEGDESDNRNRGSGGGSGSRSATITQTPSGNDIETTVPTSSGPVALRFETVQAGSGLLKVEADEISAFEMIFDEVTLGQDNDEHGIVHMGGTTYSSAGDVFDIDASAINFDGMIDVTIPYDEGVVTSISGLESDVRFLHYDEEHGIWEDNTMSVDELANTVTGRLDSLSPVIAAVIINEDASDQLVASDPSFAFSEGISSLSITLNNKLQNDKDYAIIVQVLDQNNIVQHIEWQERSISASREENVSMSWAQMEEGIYVIKVFVWTEMQNPSLLSQTSVQSS